MTRRFRHPNTLPTWLQTALGQSLIRAELQCLRPLMQGFYGPIAVQVGEAAFGSFVDLSGAPFRFSAATDPQFTGHMTGQFAGQGEEREPAAELCCVPEFLPFGTRSLGLVILPHVLEFTDYPHQILREVERVLVPEGRLVVLGFNPFSLWGVASLFGLGQMPWNGRFTSLTRLKDWLQLLNFEFTAGEMIYYRPPVQSERIRRRLRFVEKVGNRWWPLGAAVYVLAARKRRVGATHLHPRWKKSARLNPRLAKPVVRTRGPAYERSDAS